MQDLFSDLFLDNEQLQARINEFLTQSPNYICASKKVSDLDKALLQQLPREYIKLYLDYEAAANQRKGLECMGYYLFALGLRQDLCLAMWQGLL